MIEIYICDDNETARKQIREEIEKKLLIEDYDMRVVFDGGEPRSFLETVRGALQKRNVYFLDVELHDTKYDGFLLGKEIRMLDPPRYAGVYYQLPESCIQDVSVSPGSV